uniref:Uncharacterized protein n=1 Tax=Ficus carica TaxID=3494 RepID=A0AA87ZPK5_FICCA|nr:hypothetical protein TIFTF001_044137 [Ficus carica]GMN27612.1 hypothetical protein TIFTF001_044141 [Ficus carica]
MPSSKDNTEVSVVKRQLAALEKTVHELCAKHEPGVLDQQPTPNASKECHLFFDDSINGEDVLVAIGRAYMECVPTDIVHGIPLGEENVRVTITIP